jgi:hypothetical protein
MEVHINEVVSRVRAVDGTSVLTPALLQQIVAAVIAALEAVDRQDRQRRQDTRIAIPTEPESER